MVHKRRDVFNSTPVANAMLNGPDIIAYMILDENIKDHTEKVGFDFVLVIFPSLN